MPVPQTYKRAPTRCREAVAVGLAAACAALAVATDGLEPIGVSTRAQARGGADVAVGDTALSQIDNPASLALRDRFRFDFSGQLLMPRLDWTSPIGTSSSRSAHPLANLAVALPVNERLTLGLAMHSKCGMGAHYEMRHLLIPFMERHVASDCKNVSFSLNAGYKLTSRLSVGAGVRAEIATAKFNAVLGPADVSFGRGYAYGGGFALGFHYRATDTLAFGVAYRSPSWFGDLSGGNLKASIGGLLPVPLGRASMSDFRLPQRVSAGTAWDVTDRLKLIGEACWNNYSNTTFNSATVAVDGPIDLRFPLPLDYQDQWVFITGAEFKLDENWTLGAGYNYATDIVPRSNLFPIMAATTQHHITAGLRYHRGNWWVGGAYILGLGPAVTGSGFSRIPLGIDYGLSRVEQQQHSVCLGFGFDS